MLYLWKWGTGKTKVLIDNIGVLFTTQDIDSALIIATKSVYTILGQ